jgi:hypothetical protein
VGWTSPKIDKYESPLANVTARLSVNQTVAEVKEAIAHAAAPPITRATLKVDGKPSIPFNSRSNGTHSVGRTRKTVVTTKAMRRIPGRTLRGVPRTWRVMTNEIQALWRKRKKTFVRESDYWILKNDQWAL